MPAAHPRTLGMVMVIGIAVTVAAAAGLPEGPAVTFAVLGTGLICLGALMRVLEGAVEVGPKGFKAHLRERA